MSYHMEVENLLHQAYVDQLQGNIDGCLTKQVQAMSILEEVKSHCSEAEKPAISLKLDNIASEFNMIRSMHPEVEVQIHSEPEAPAASEEVPPRQEAATESFAQPQAVPIGDAATNNSSFMETVNQTCDDVFSYMKEMDEKYHITEEIKESLKKGKENVTEFFSGDVKEKVKEGYNNVATWVKENRVAEKAAYGVKCVLCIVIKGVVVSTHFITKSVKEIIAKSKENETMKARPMSGVVIPPPVDAQSVFPQPVPAAPMAPSAVVSAEPNPNAAASTEPAPMVPSTVANTEPAPMAPMVPSAVVNTEPVHAAESLPVATPVPPEVVAQLSSSPRN